MYGYDKKALQGHVPALVYTLYDGCYIYSPYTQVLEEDVKNSLKSSVRDKYATIDDVNNDVNVNNKREYQLKPYVYYSCRYKKGNDFDVVITYSLDSYISIRGKIKNSTGTTEYIDISGYLLSSAKGISENEAKYRNITINTEEVKLNTANFDPNNLPVNTGDTINETYCRKINGVTYYQVDPEATPPSEIFYISNGKKQIQSTSGEIKNAQGDEVSIKNNTNAVEYYSDAEKLKEKIMNTNLKDIKIEDAVNENGQKYTELQAGDKERNLYGMSSEPIFGELNNGTDLKKVQIEDDDSNFNSHRLDVIKHSVERNLAIAINNFNNVSSYSTDFQLPKLKDSDWDKLIQNIGMISFLQGLNIGGKMYNGYAIVINNKNKEFVSEQSIYIMDTGGNYHRVMDSDLLESTANLKQGFFNIDFEMTKANVTIKPPTSIEAIETEAYYFPKEGTGCYHSIVNQDNVEYSTYEAGSDEARSKSIAEHLGLKGAGTPTQEQKNLAEIYYTALARERQGIYRVRNIF